jgi:hypothetical protein
MTNGDYPRRFRAELVRRVVAQGEIHDAFATLTNIAFLPAAPSRILALGFGAAQVERMVSIGIEDEAALWAF